MHRAKRVLIALTLATASAAACAPPAQGPHGMPPGGMAEGGEEARAEYVPGPPVDLTGPISLTRLSALARERHPEITREGEHAERELTRHLGHTYVEYITALVDLTLIVDHAELLNRAVQTIQARVQAGAAPTLDRDRVQIELSLLQLARMRAENTVHHVATELNMILLRALDAPLGAPSDADPGVITLSDEELVTRARAHNPHATTREAQEGLREAVSDVAAHAQRVVQEIAHLQTDTQPAAADMLTQSRAHYEAGRLDLAGWIDALRLIFHARTEHAAAVSELARANVDLEAIVGTELPRSAMPAGHAAARSPDGNPAPNAPAAPPH